MPLKSLLLTLCTLLIVNISGCGVPAATVYFKAIPINEWKRLEDKDRFLCFDNDEIFIQIWASYLLNAIHIRNEKDIDLKIKEDKKKRENISIFISLSAKTDNYQIRLDDILLQTLGKEEHIKPDVINLVDNGVTIVPSLQDITTGHRTYRLDYPIYEWEIDSFKIKFAKGVIVNSKLNLSKISYIKHTKQYRAFW